MSNVSSSKTAPKNAARASRSKKSAPQTETPIVAETVTNLPAVIETPIEPVAITEILDPVVAAPQSNEPEILDANVIMDDFGNEVIVMAQPVVDLELLNDEMALIAAPVVTEDYDADAEFIKALAEMEIEPRAESANSAAEVGIVDHHSQMGSWGVSEASRSAQAEANETVTAYDELLSTIEPEKIDNMVTWIADAMDARADFEERKNPENSNIQRTLKKAREQLVTKRAAKVLIAANVDPAFINRTLHDGSRYNVYALGKLADVVYAITDKGTLGNAINRACMKSLFATRAAGFTFTLETAKAAASDKVQIDAAIRKVLIRHTVSASTAPTQASSTMQALATLGVVKAEGSTRNPVYKLTNHPVVEKLEVLLKAA